MPATMGLVLSKVCIAPPKDFFAASMSVSISSLPPRRFSRGILQLSKMRVAVSDALIPSFFSSLATLNPGVPFSTKKDLIAVLPILLLRVAHTTTQSDRSPSVT